MPRKKKKNTYICICRHFNGHQFSDLSKRFWDWWRTAGAALHASLPCDLYRSLASLQQEMPSVSCWFGQNYRDCFGCKLKVFLIVGVDMIAGCKRHWCFFCFIDEHDLHLPAVIFHFFLEKLAIFSKVELILYKIEGSFHDFRMMNLQEVFHCRY